MPNYFFPDLTYSEIGLERKNFIAEVTAGPWQLLRTIQRDPARIALLYSQPSIQANFTLNREQRCQRVRNAWVDLLHDSGLQFDFVAYEELKAPGFLSRQGYKVLILPEALALSPQEVAQITAFAQAGGVVIADNSAGWMDEHCRTLKTGQLDQLFGLSANRDPLVGVKPKLVLSEDWGGMCCGDEVVGFAPLGKITPSKAAPLLTSTDTNAGAIYRNSVGKGQAVYLNLSLVPYREERQMGGHGELIFRRLIGGALALARVHPEFPMEATGKKAFQGHVVSFTDAGARYLGLIREADKDEPAESFVIRLPASCHAYDVRAKRYLGKTDRINAVLGPGAARLYALMPEEIAAPTLDAPSTVGARIEGEAACRDLGIAEVAPSGPRGGV